MAGHKEDKEGFEVELDSRSDLSLSKKKERAENLLEKGQKLREKGEYDQGIDVLLEALELGIKQDEVYYRLGNTFYDADDLDRAEYSYERSIEENEEHANAQHNLAVVYREQGKIDKSVKQRKKANKIQINNPKDPDLSDDDKSFVKKLALKMFLFLTLGITGLGLVVYLISIFFF
jgi:tetratricopeptide (TPR) repeat protein